MTVGVRRHPILLTCLVILCVGVAGGCSPGTSPTPARTATRTATTPPATGDSTTLLADAIVADIFARQDSETSDPSTTLLPPSLVSYFDAQNIPTLTVKTETDPLVDRACQLVELPFAKQVLSKAADLILSRLKVRGAGKGIGMLVSATKFGCKHLVPFLTEKTITADIPALPLPTPGPKTIHAAIGEHVNLKYQDGRRFSVTASELYCTAGTQQLRAEPGYALIAAKIRIDSRSDGVVYDAAYWDLTTDNANTSYFVPTSDAPFLPYLTYGTLNADQWTEGWLLFHVLQPSNSIELSYLEGSPSRPPVVQVDLPACPPL